MIADDSRANIYFNITSPAPGTFIIALHFKGRDKPILEMDLKIDDLLEKVSLMSTLHVPSRRSIPGDQPLIPPTATRSP